MAKSRKIRAIALGLIQDGDRLLLSEGYDPHRKQTFYRALGGGIEFGETSRQALEREFMEELQAELTEIEYLACLENIFTYNNRPGHEIIQLYRAQLVNRELYQQDVIPFLENTRSKTARWVDLQTCKSGELRVVPATFLHYC
ncbi:NUDIX hydrolase [Roseofilum casamattae]|uniref:NUDIX hydrolase n=1 Tax=Roseofilum casamattae BLCC-M143 TaxID=3022442 RepID=A0ABT7BXQ3_9CYAN|nr:NUDIX hydrolase [Roseofilum casamattae]MDJ1183246.1 NUDIX hydrolase [Roseofilum casamattae BLCC-M143]